jgi:hypothetical protein
MERTDGFQRIQWTSTNVRTLSSIWLPCAGKHTEWGISRRIHGYYLVSRNFDNEIKTNRWFAKYETGSDRFGEQVAGLRLQGFDSLESTPTLEHHSGFSETTDWVSSLSHFRDDCGRWNFLYLKSALNSISTLPMQACCDQECGAEQDAKNSAGYRRAAIVLFRDNQET